MKIQKVIILTTLLFSFLLSDSHAQVLGDLWGDALGTDYTSYNDKKFLKILKRSQAKAIRSNSMEPDIATSAPNFKITKYSEESGSTTWHVPIYASHSIDSDEYRYMTIKSAFINYRSSFTFTFLTQEIKAEAFEKTTKSDDFEEFKEDFFDEFDDMEVDLTLYGKQIMLTATYSFKEGVSMGDLDDHVYFLANSAGGIQSRMMAGEYNWAIDYKEELRDKEFTYINKNEFITLAGFDIGEFVEEDEDAKEGYFNLTLGIYNHMLYNYGDSLVFNVWIDAPDNIGGEDIDEIWKEINEEIRDDSFSESKYSKVGMYEKYPSTFWLEVSIDLSKGIDGDDLEEMFSEYVKEYVPDFKDKLDDLFEDYE